jgi:hypothetical protein
VRKTSEEYKARGVTFAPEMFQLVCPRRLLDVGWPAAVCGGSADGSGRRPFGPSVQRQDAASASRLRRERKDVQGSFFFPLQELPIHC